jgi:hypothetical protein
MAEQSFSSSENQGSNKTLWYVLSGVVVVALVLGGALWFYGNSLVEEPKPTPRPVVNVPPPVVVPSPTVVASPVPVAADINVVSESKNVVFPKAGRVYIYYLFINSSVNTRPYIFDLVSLKANISVQSPGGLPTAPKLMHVIDTGLDVTAGESISVQPYDFGDFDKPSSGWIKPRDGNNCGVAPFGINDMTKELEWVRSEMAKIGEPVVAEQCWADWGGTQDQDYNDFLVVLTYGPVTKTTSPSPSATVTPSPSTAATTTSTTTTTSPTPTPSSTPRTATVDTSAGVPVTGVIEDTIKALGIGVGMIVLGLLLL